MEPVRREHQGFDLKAMLQVADQLISEDKVKYNITFLHKVLDLASREATLKMLYSLEKDDKLLDRISTLVEILEPKDNEAVARNFQNKYMAPVFIAAVAGQFFQKENAKLEEEFSQESKAQMESLLSERSELINDKGKMLKFLLSDNVDFTDLLKVGDIVDITEVWRDLSQQKTPSRPSSSASRAPKKTDLLKTRTYDVDLLSAYPEIVEEIMEKSFLRSSKLFAVGGAGSDLSIETTDTAATSATITPVSSIPRLAISGSFDLSRLPQKASASVAPSEVSQVVGDKKKDLDI